VRISGPPNNQTFSANLNGRPLPESLSQSIARFGAPTSERRYGPDGGVNCRVDWPTKHVTGTFTVAYGGPPSDACTSGAGTVLLTLTAGWRTDTGLRVGQPVADLQRIYPDATVTGDYWALVRYFYGAGFYVTELGAVTRSGVITALTVAGVPDE
jgi:hypothetical protein